MFLNKFNYFAKYIPSYLSSPLSRSMSTDISPKLVNIRKLMTELQLDSYVVTHNNPHQSEMLPPGDERLAFISGFNGSNGLAVITQDKALMWTDSRYYIQAEKQLEAGWEMMKMEMGAISWFNWIAQNNKAGSIVGFNPYLYPAARSITISETLKKSEIELRSIESDLVDKLWTDKPPANTDKVIIHDVKYCGRSVAEKLQDIGKHLKTKEVSNHVVCDLESIAWTLNIRGFDAKVTPYVVSYLILNFTHGDNDTTCTGTLYIDSQKLSPELEEHLKSYNISIKPYGDVLEDVKKLQGKVYLNMNTTSAAIYNSISDKENVVKDSEDIIEVLKGVKNPREVQGFADCHIRDGAAIVRYFAWLEHQLNVEKRTDIDEYRGWIQLEKFRSEQELNKGYSFEAISSIGANGAIVHYRPEEGKAALLNNKEMYLLDNGGQYLDGTTDTTRVTHFGEPTKEEIDCYTRVLLGNLDVERVNFPAGKKYSGADVDVLARRHLWEAGLDFGHGTGHGVGYFNNVHEGPHGISKYRTYPFEAGMIVTDEPGYYKEGAFGIRIENILVVEEKSEKFLGFRNLTMVPYERKLIDTNLAKTYLDHINAYHQQVSWKVLKNLKPILEAQNDKIAIAYLEEKCKAI